jgi:hypothetical protein
MPQLQNLIWPLSAKGLHKISAIGGAPTVVNVRGTVDILEQDIGVASPL